MLSAKTFCAALRFVQHAAAVKDVRYYLQATFLEFQAPNRLSVVATDGKRMAVVQLEADHGLGDASFLIGSDQVKRILALYGKVLGELELCPAMDASLVIVDIAQAITFPVVDGRFPQWGRVLPTGEPTGLQGVFNPEFVGDLMYAAGSLQKAATFPAGKFCTFGHQGVGKVLRYDADLTGLPYPGLVAAFGLVVGYQDPKPATDTEVKNG